jgi:hypothetical protein
MNKLEVGKSYETISGYELLCIDIHENRTGEFAALCVYKKSGHVAYYSVQGVSQDGIKAACIKWPVKFKPGQLVMVRDGDDFAWQQQVYVSLGEPKSFRCGCAGIVTSVFEQCRHPTESEWFEFREGKK